MKLEGRGDNIIMNARLHHPILLQCAHAQYAKSITSPMLVLFAHAQLLKIVILTISTSRITLVEFPP